MAGTTEDQLAWSDGNCTLHSLAVVNAPVAEVGNVEAKDKDSGRTPLSWAADYGYEAVVQQLLAQGADVETTDKYGWTPLLRAAVKGHEAVVRQLLTKGANIETKASGQTPLSWAAMRGREAVVRQLLAQGANVETKCPSGWTPLLWAAENGHEAVI